MSLWWWGVHTIVTACDGPPLTHVGKRLWRSGRVNKGVKLFMSSYLCQATYGNLLDLFLKAKHSGCAITLCEVLRKKCECYVVNDDCSCSYIGACQSTSALPHVVARGKTAPHMMRCLKDQKGIKMQSQHLVWYDEVSFASCTDCTCTVDLSI